MRQQIAVRNNFLKELKKNEELKTTAVVASAVDSSGIR